MASLIAPRSAAEREAARQLAEALQARTERALAGDMIRVFREAAKEAGSAYVAGHDALASPFIAERLPVLIGAAVQTRQRQAAQRFGVLVRRDLKSAYAHERKGWEEDFNLWLDQWVATYTARKVVRITETTRDEIRHAIDAAVAAGFGQERAARAIRDRVGGVIGVARARTIGRTEANAASNAGTLASAESLGIDFAREWIAASDERTRESHRMADGQTRRQNESFDVGGYSLMHPGDPTGPAGEVINCRCSTALQPL